MFSAAVFCPADNFVLDIPVKLHEERAVSGHADDQASVFFRMLLDGCMEHGRDCTRGGAKYNHIGIQGVGMADVADSLTVLKKLVFDEPRVSREEILEAMRTNFEGKEVLRQIFLNRVPKYGNDIEEADGMAAWVAELYCDCVRGKATVRGGSFRPGLFCLSSNTPLGRQVCALPSGRQAGTPLGDGGLSPKHSMDTHGPTAAARSVAKIPQTLAINGVNYNMKFPFFKEVLHIMTDCKCFPILNNLIVAMCNFMCYIKWDMIFL